MLTIEQIRKKLQDENAAEIARIIGVTRAYVSAIKNGNRVNPSYEVIKRLSDLLEDSSK